METDIFTFKILTLGEGQARLVVWENDQVVDIYEASPRQVRNMAIRLMDRKFPTEPQR